MSRRSPSPSSSHSPNLNTATHSSTTTSTSSSGLHLRRSASSPMSDEDDNIPPPTSTSPRPPHTATTSSTNSRLNPSPGSARTPSFPIREDCWSEEATHTLVEAWGSHYIELNRGNLRQKQWQEVADAVNAVHGHTKKLQRSDVQCKNRIDTLKKKYKVEKAKFVESNGRYVSPWPFFPELDSLIGDSFLKPNHPPRPTRKGFASSVPSPSPSPVRKEFLALPPPPSIVPVGPRSKRPAHGMVHSDDLRFLQKFPGAMGRGEEEEEEEDEGSETYSGVANGSKRRKRRRGEEVEVEVGEGVKVKGYGQLAEAIGRFAEIYERVEEAKQRQMLELEKERMQFAKDLEIQRMKLFMESLLHLEKLKLSKRRSQADGYS